MANGAAASEAAAGEPHEQSPLLEAVGFYALESRSDGVLWDRAPACVIMYDSDVAFVRQLEVGTVATAVVPHPAYSPDSSLTCASACRSA